MANWGPDPVTPHRPTPAPLSACSSLFPSESGSAVPTVRTVTGAASNCGASNCDPPEEDEEEVTVLRRQLSDFTSSLRMQLQRYEEGQHRLLARLEQLQQPLQKWPLVVSLDPDDLDDQGVSTSPAFTPSRSPPRGNTSREEVFCGWNRAARESNLSLPEKSRLRQERLKRTLGERGWLLVGKIADWWLGLSEPHRDGALARFVSGKGFEGFCAFLVALNSMLIVYTTNYEAHHLEESQSLEVRVLNACFVAFYVVELLLRASVHGRYFFLNRDAGWNSFDLALVTVALLDLVYSEAARGGGVSVAHLRTVRALRILRATKVLRLFRLVRFFSQLRVLLGSVMGSLVSLFWGVVMLAFIFFIFALVFVQGATLAQLEGGSALSSEERQGLQEHLGSTEAGMLLLLQSVTGGEDWALFYRHVQLTGAVNCALFLFFISFAQLALLNILTGIFVENAMKLAEPDRDTAALLQRKQELSEAEELRKLCKSIDVKGSGLINEDQFLEQLKSEQFKAKMALLGLDMKHAELFFNSVCTDFGRREVDIEAFVAGAMRLKGHASALDLQTLTFGTKLIREEQLRLFRALDLRLEALWPGLPRLPGSSPEGSCPPAAAN